MSRRALRARGRALLRAWVDRLGSARRPAPGTPSEADDSTRGARRAISSASEAVSTRAELQAYAGIHLAATYLQAVVAGDHVRAAALLNAARITELRWMAACLGAELREALVREAGGDRHLLVAAFRCGSERADAMVAVYGAELVLREAQAAGL